MHSACIGWRSAICQPQAFHLPISAKQLGKARCYVDHCIHSSSAGRSSPQLIGASQSSLRSSQCWIIWLALVSVALAYTSTKKGLQLAMTRLIVSGRLAIAYHWRINRDQRGVVEDAVAVFYVSRRWFKRDLPEHCSNSYFRVATKAMNPQHSPAHLFSPRSTRRVSCLLLHSRLQALLVRHRVYDHLDPEGI
jgi:hypothetical protein